VDEDYPAGLGIIEPLPVSLNEAIDVALNQSINQSRIVHYGE